MTLTDEFSFTEINDFSESLQYALIFGVIQWLLWLPIKFDPEDRMAS